MRKFLLFVLQTLKLLLIIERLESQIKELTERSILLEFRLNQAIVAVANLLQMSTLSKRSKITRVDINKIVRDLSVKKVIEGRLLIWLMIMIGQYNIF